MAYFRPSMKMVRWHQKACMSMGQNKVSGGITILMGNLPPKASMSQETKLIFGNTGAPKGVGKSDRVLTMRLNRSLSSQGWAKNRPLAYH